MAARDRGWWDDFFEPFRPVFGIVDRRTTTAQVRYLIDKLGLKPGRKFLDCPCGIGRISIPLARKGIKVTGVDITQSYLDELAQKAKRAGLKIPVQRSDMRRITYDREFHAAGNLWTSFGLFEQESDNILVIRRLFRALKPGGKCVLQLINRDWVLANYQKESWLSIKNRRGREVGRVLQSNTFDYRTSISHSSWIFQQEGKEIVRDAMIRMYSFHELVAMFKKVGFVDIEGYGTIKDEPISREQRMMWVFGTRPKR